MSLADEGLVEKDVKRCVDCPTLTIADAMFLAGLDTDECKNGTLQRLILQRLPCGRQISFDSYFSSSDSKTDDGSGVIVITAKSGNNNAEISPFTDSIISKSIEKIPSKKKLAGWIPCKHKVSGWRI